MVVLSFTKSLFKLSKVTSSSLGFYPEKVPWLILLLECIMEENLVLFHSCGSLGLVPLNTHFVTLLFPLLLHLPPIIPIPIKTPSRSTQGPVFYMPCSQKLVLKKSICYHCPLHFHLQGHHQCLLQLVLLQGIMEGAEAHPSIPGEVMIKMTP